MRRALRVFSFLACAAALCAQAPSAAPGNGGLETDWDIAPVLQKIGEHAAGLLPLLEKVDARSWVEKGASDTYLKQLQTSREQARALADGAKALSRNPERLSASLELYFRIQGLGILLNSLADGVRRYQSPAQAQALTSAAIAGDANRDRLQEYIVNLAAQREHDLAVMDKEAQRCRGLVTQAPPAKTGRKK